MSRFDKPSSKTVTILFISMNSSMSTPRSLMSVLWDSITCFSKRKCQLQSSFICGERTVFPKGPLGRMFWLLLVILQLPESTNCMACSEDGRYLSLGHSGGLSVWCASSLICVAEWLQDRMEMTSVQMTSMAETAYLLGSIDDMGG